MKELLFGMKEKTRDKDNDKNRMEDEWSGANGSSQTDLRKSGMAHLVFSPTPCWRT